LTRTNNTARTGLSRATVREIDDKHLLQQIKKADVFHSETPSDFERFQMVGITAVPLPQDEDQQQSQNQNKQSSSGDDGMNHNQPKGKSAEALMLYMNGQRSHPVGMIDDRRVRPFNMKAGESSFYSASGTGQMLLHSDKGSFLVVVDNKGHESQGSGGGQEEQPARVVSLRHVTKEKQSREIKEGQEPEEYVHEGKADQVNTEVRASATKIEILDGENIIAVYNKEDQSWTFSNFKKLTLQPEDEFNVTTKAVNIQASESMKIQTPEQFELDGHPLLVNGGGPTIPPFTVT
jgi:phage gp45-like